MNPHDRIERRRAQRHRRLLLTFALLPLSNATAITAQERAGGSEVRLELSDSLATWYALGIGAHHLCAGLWVVGRDHERSAETVVAEDIAPFPAFRWEDAFDYDVSMETRTVTVTDPRVGERRARYSGDQGCAILPAGAADVFFTPTEVPPALPDPSEQDWPMGDRGAHASFDDVDTVSLEATLDWAFDDANLDRKSVV